MANLFERAACFTDIHYGLKQNSRQHLIDCDNYVTWFIEEAKAMADHGVVFGAPQTDINKIRIWKDKVVTQLTGGLGGMAKMRDVKVVNGFGKFTGPNTIEVEGEENTTVTFDNAIIAAGSRPIKLPFIPHEDPRIWDSTDALELKEVPETFSTIEASTK